MAQTTASIRPASLHDAGAIARIYNHYIANTVVTFEEEAVSEAEIAQRIRSVQAVSLSWFVAERAGEVVGYSYATSWRPRAAYRHSAETTVYLAPGEAGRGIGSALYQYLISALSDQQIHAIIGGIALPNPASVALHEKFGFHKVAHFEQVGFKLGRWVDVGYWQRILHTSPETATKT